MFKASTITSVRSFLDEARAAEKTVGLVPTMGALHLGHLKLLQRARVDCGIVAVSVFVNPTQFGPGEDYDCYPRNIGRDCELCRSEGVDVVFAPSVAEMYPNGFGSSVEVSGLVAETLEGECRPGHFRGVATVCSKLFNIIQPDYAYFGLKDYQQLAVIRKMVNDLNVPAKIVGVETVREADGLAMSSRNTYLSDYERRAAVVLSASLREARSRFEAGERTAERIESSARLVIESEPLARIDYLAIRDAETLAPLVRVKHAAVLLLAVRIGSTRLIDNVVLQP